MDEVFSFSTANRAMQAQGWVSMGHFLQASATKGLQQTAEGGTWEICSIKIYT